MRDSIQRRIREHIIEAWLNGDGRGLADDMDLQRAGILDSFSTLALVSFLEESFQVQIDPVEINAQTFRDVHAIAALVLEKLSVRGAVPKSAEL